MCFPAKTISEIVPIPPPIHLLDLEFQDGNISFEEYLILAQLVAHFQPRTLLELGTFDGNTTALLAANTGSDAVIHTVDLPTRQTDLYLPIDREDKKYIFKEKSIKKFQSQPFASKIIQHFADTAVYDFSLFSLQKPVDFIFIDASHSYEYVKNDTEKSLEILGNGGMILWHDYTPLWPGVHHYLSELSKQLPLFRIPETTFAFFQKKEG